MTTASRGWLLSATLLSFATHPAAAQLGELQLGVRGSYATGSAFGPGGGLTFGIAPGRVSYVGINWTYHAGRTSGQQGTAVGEVTNRAQLITADFGVMIPAGRLDIIPFVSFGTVRFSQRQITTVDGSNEHSDHKTEFVTGPGLAAEVHVRSVAVIPELQYLLAGDPQLAAAVQHRGMALSIRLVIPVELHRIRR